MNPDPGSDGFRTISGNPELHDQARSQFSEKWGWVVMVSVLIFFIIRVLYLFD